MATKKVASLKKPTVSKTNAKKASPSKTPKTKTSSAPGDSAKAHEWLMRSQGVNTKGLPQVSHDAPNEPIESDIPEEVHDIPDEDDTTCGPTEEDLGDAVLVTIEPDERPRFVKGGKPGPGRPKGSRNKIAEEFFSDFYSHWLENGRAAIQWVFENKPDVYFNGAIKVLPQQVDVRVSEFAELTDEALDKKLAEMSSQLSAALTILQPTTKAN
jgi:hypothetical protein